MDTVKPHHVLTVHSSQAGGTAEDIPSETLMAQLKETDLQTYKNILLSLRSRLRGDVNTLADSALRKGRTEGQTSMPIHMADVGTENFEQEFSLNLMENDEEKLQVVEAALERISQGVYGLCVECEARIPKMRLNAIPFTPHCIKCASRLEGNP